MSLQTITKILQSGNIQTAQVWPPPDPSNKFNVDPLACSVASVRVFGSYGIQADETLLTAEDYTIAADIRKYYAKKYFWNSIKTNRPQSEYRANAQRLLSIEKNWRLTDRETGLFVKLPAFYAEDIVYDKFISQFKTDIDTYKGTSTPDAVKKLTYLEKTFRWQNVKRVSYWFTDDENHLINFTTASDHPFNALFEDKIQTPQVFKFARGIDRIGAMWHNTIRSFTILN